jgi:homocysteine S-methyltransferase
MPHIADGAAVYDLTPDQMASAALKYADLGARVVGGCCGSTPEHISAIAKAIRSRK